MSMCRQIDGCEKSVSEALVGSKGQCVTSANARYMITGKQSWSLDPKIEKNPYVVEHTDLIAAIRAGKPYNELKQTAESTLTAIMGRRSTYTGKAVTWEEALGSQEALVPQNMAFGSMLVPPVAIPGQTKLA